jgi:hypothetical protein
MSYLNVVTVLSFHKYNPGWKIVVYNAHKVPIKKDKEISNLKYQDYEGEDYFYMLEELPYVQVREFDINRYRVHSVLVSDIWRREILYENGGVYSDFDVIWLRPMSEFENIECIGNPKDFEAVVSFYNYTHGFHNVSNLIAEKGSLFIKSMMDAVKRVKRPFGDQSFGTKMVNKLYPTLESIIDLYPRVLAIKYETFYPYSTFNMQQLFIENDLTPIDNKNVMCIHWFNGNILSKQYINGNEYKDCSMTTILKNEGYDFG